MKTGILNEIRVIDFTRVLAGPYATRLLADFGAEVIKIQSKKTTGGAESNVTGYFNAWNRNKRSITLDLSFSEAKQIILDLIAISDVAVENFSPRVMSNWGLSYENLKTVNHDLVMISLSGMGQTGPWKDFVAFGPTVQSLGGLSYLTSYSADSPVGIGYSYSDTMSGIYGALAVLAALEYRDQTGKGQYIDLSEYEVVSTLIGPMLMDACIHNRDETLVDHPSNHYVDNLANDPLAAPYGCYPCLGSDRWCVIAVYNEIQWKALCSVIKQTFRNADRQPDWIDDDRFHTLSSRKVHAEILDTHISQWTAQNHPESLVQKLLEKGTPAGVVQDAKDLAADPQLRARNFFVHLNHPVLGDTISDRSPIVSVDNSTATWKAAPLLGEANAYVYQTLLGFTEEKLCAYIEKGIIG